LDVSFLPFSDFSGLADSDRRAAATACAGAFAVWPSCWLLWAGLDWSSGLPFEWPLDWEASFTVGFAASLGATDATSSAKGNASPALLVSALACDA